MVHRCSRGPQRCHTFSTARSATSAIPIARKGTITKPTNARTGTNRSMAHPRTPGLADVRVSWCMPRATGKHNKIRRSRGRVPAWPAQKAPRWVIAPSLESPQVRRGHPRNTDLLLRLRAGKPLLAGCHNHAAVEAAPTAELNLNTRSRRLGKHPGTHLVGDRPLPVPTARPRSTCACLVE